MSWKVMAEYSSPSSDWQRVKMSLPEVNKVYQIAFEGKDNLGRGIVLDAIKLQGAPECTIPERITVFNKGAGKVNIAWSASWDANFFEVIVSKDTIDPDRSLVICPYARKNIQQGGFAAARRPQQRDELPFPDGK